MYRLKEGIKCMAGIRDVAKLAGVSTATVSRALSNPETVRLETRNKVKQAIKELNYKPNMLAQQFRTNETGMSTLNQTIFLRAKFR